MKTILSHTGKRCDSFSRCSPSCRWPAPPIAPRLRNPNDPFWQKHSPAQYRVRVETSRGVFVLEVHRDWAPIGADRFYNLVRAGFYDDSRFYRVTARFAQFGIPGNPAVAAVWRTPTLPDDPVRESNTRGRFAFAMTGPNARTTQIYICKTDMSAPG